MTVHCILPLIECTQSQPTAAVLKPESQMWCWVLQFYFRENTPETSSFAKQKRANKYICQNLAMQHVLSAEKSGEREICIIAFQATGMRWKMIKNSFPFSKRLWEAYTACLFHAANSCIAHLSAIQWEKISCQVLLFTYK